MNFHEISKRNFLVNKKVICGKIICYLFGNYVAASAKPHQCSLKFPSITLLSTLHSQHSHSYITLLETSRAGAEVRDLDPPAQSNPLNQKVAKVRFKNLIEPLDNLHPARPQV